MYYFILNPVAGNERLKSIQNKLKQRISSKNILGEYVKTSGEADAEHLARIAIKKGYSTIIAVGGDGTFNEILNGVCGHDVTLGFIPIGISNRTARVLGVPVSWERAIDVIVQRNIESYDVAKIIESKDYMFLSGGIGAESYVNTKANYHGLFEYFIGINARDNLALILKDYKPIKVRFIIDKQYSITCSVLLASVVNSVLFKDVYGTSQKFNYKDGLLDLIILSSLPNTAMIPNIIQSFDSYLGSYVSHLRAREIHIESFEEQLKVHIDGRVLYKTPCTFRVHPARQRFIVGKSS